ncbi:hypothetical protein DIPPA_28495 [Diplonema papillatum]|nr:hypothetical protein DIPPA_28495 [Diplonema papillatum]
MRLRHLPYGNCLLDTGNATFVVDVTVGFARDADGNLRVDREWLATVDWSEVDAVFVSTPDGLRGLVYAAHYHGFTGKVFAPSDPVVDAGKLELWSMADRTDILGSFSRHEADATMKMVEICGLNRVQRVEGAHVIGVPSNGCVGGAAWLFQRETELENSVLVCNAGTPRHPEESITVAAYVVALRASAGTKGGLSVATLASREVNRGRYSILPLHLTRSYFEALAHARAMQESSPALQLAVVTRHKQFLSEVGARVYEFLDEGAKAAVAIPDRPFHRNGKATIPCFSMDDVQKLGVFSRPLCLVLPDPASLDDPGLLPALLSRILKDATSATGVTVFLPSQTMFSPSHPDHPLSCFTDAATPSADPPTDPATLGLISSLKSTGSPSLAEPLRVVRAPFHFTENGNAASFELVARTLGATLILAASLAVDQEVECPDAGGSPAKRRRYLPGGIKASSLDPAAAKLHCAGGEVFCPLGPARLTCRDGTCSVVGAGRAASAVGAFDRVSFEKALRKEAPAVVSGAGDCLTADVPSLNTTLEIRPGRTVVNFSGDPDQLKQVRNAVASAFAAL